MHFSGKFPLLLTIFFMLIVCDNCYAKESSPYDFLIEVKNKSANIKTLKTSFLQEKYVNFLNKPIITSGNLYFAKQDNHSYSLLWEYDSPAASGIWFHNSSSWIWTQTRDNLRKVQGIENKFINSIIQQMIFWLKINPQEIEHLYTLELVAKYTIKLFPKNKDIFKSITVTFNADLQSLKSLILEEEQGNYTSLSFFETEYNPPALRTFPDGTILP